MWFLETSGHLYGELSGHRNGTVEKEKICKRHSTDSIHGPLSQESNTLPLNHEELMKTCAVLINTNTVLQRIQSSVQMSGGILFFQMHLFLQLHSNVPDMQYTAIWFFYHEFFCFMNLTIMTIQNGKIEPWSFIRINNQPSRFLEFGSFKLKEFFPEIYFILQNFSGYIHDFHRHNTGKDLQCCV